MYTEDKIVYLDDTKQVLVSCKDKGITSIKIDGNVKFIEENAFKDCYLLKDLILDTKGSIKINSFAFPEPSIERITVKCETYLEEKAVNSKYLKEILFTGKINHFNSDFFFDCGDVLSKNLEKIEIKNVLIKDSTRNDYTKDGIWYAKEWNDEVLLFYPPAKKASTFTVPSFVTQIDEKCFVENPFLEEIIITSPEVYIYKEAFMGCKNLKRLIFLDKEAKAYLEYCIKDCGNLTEIVTDSKSVNTDGIKIVPLSNYLESASFKSLNNIYKDLER